ncbi:MAG: cobaltochelatase subunit CobN [Pirellulaceae bacterium]|nr:cobaltochelatase subunit CobN [Pirellulaceae bacterium]
MKKIGAIIGKRQVVQLAVATVLLVLCTTAALYAYQRYLRNVRVALIGFRDSDWGLWCSAAEGTSYTLHRFEREELASAPLANYHAVLIRAMGYRPPPEDLKALAAARAAGTRIVMLMSTSETASNEENLEQEHRQRIDAYLKHGGEDNLRGLLDYLARELAGREVAVRPVVERPQEGFFHLGETVFATLAEYEAYLSAQRPRLMDADAPRVVLFGPFLDPLSPLERGPVDDLLNALERRGVRVYPVFGSEPLPRIEAVQPDLAIVFPHGRLARGEEGPQQLARLGIPCLSALHLIVDRQEWLDDMRGMSAGLLSQSITMPELDGVIEPLVISAMEPDEQGLRVRTTLPARFDRYVDRVANWLKLRRTPNDRKRVAIVYYKSPGASALAASGLEVVPSLYQTLARLRDEGYDLGDEFPSSPEALYELIQQRGRTVGQWAVGAYEQFLEEARPELVPVEQYAAWFQAALSPLRQQDMIERWGPIPGKHMVTQRDGQGYLAVSRIRFGNVVIMPQPTAGAIDGDDVATVHGTGEAPPHFYLGAYLWARHGFQADAIVHFGTHGSLEFTFGKSAALSDDCWPDILIGDLPHIYPYVINNVGEALVAKRRSYGVIVSHLTPPFTDAGLYGELERLHELIHEFEYCQDEALEHELRKSITDMVRQMDMGADLGLDDAALKERLLDDQELRRLHDCLHELKDQHIPDGLHVIGRPFQEDQIRNTAAAMLGSRGWQTVQAVLPAAEGHRDDAAERQSDVMRQLLDFVRQQVSPDAPAKESDPPAPSAEPSEDEEIEPAAEDSPEDQPAAATSGWFDSPEQLQRLLEAAEPETAEAFRQLLDTAAENARALEASPAAELDGLVTALAGGYVAPSSGADVLRNPAAAPTGRNLYSINAEQMPSEEAWRVGVAMADGILAEHLAAKGQYPQRVAFSLWGGEFIRTRGATIAQILHLVGVRPKRDGRGTLYEVEIVPSEELGRPRIDVVVQTSGQFRDAAASRIALIDKAVQMVAELGDEAHPNFVRDNTGQTEEELKRQGYSPREARGWATARVFGAAGNANYGTGIMGMVERGDTWETEDEIAQRYLDNMSGVYRGDGVWGTVAPGLFQTQLAGAEIVVQPRSSNTWGPLSLDHVYEFMGGISLAIRNTTGNDPTGYFSDLRDPARPRAATAAAAIREEARTQVWNPRFIAGMQREGPSAAAALTENVRNLYGWNVMQPSAVSQTLWDETFAVYIDDKHGLDLQAYFEKTNAAALQDMTAIMLETIRKGLWTPSDEVVQRLAELHAELVARHGAGCSYETCGNAKLHEFLSAALSAPGSEAAPDVAESYHASLATALQSAQPLPEVEGMQLEEKRTLAETILHEAGPLATALLASLIIAATTLLVLTGLTHPTPLVA